MTRYQIGVCTGLTDQAIYKGFQTGDLHGKKDEHGRWNAEPGAVYQFAMRLWHNGRHLMLPPQAVEDYIVAEMAGKEHEPERTRPRKGGGDNER